MLKALHQATPDYFDNSDADTEGHGFAMWDWRRDKLLCCFKVLSIKHLEEATYGWARLVDLGFPELDIRLST